MAKMAGPPEQDEAVAIFGGANSYMAHPSDLAPAPIALNAG